MIRVQIFCISGFRQGLGDDNGTLALAERLRQYQSEHVQVDICTWADDWKGRAELVDALCEKDAIIVAAAYSWGAGYGLRQLAKYLRRKGRNIHSAVLCDPVHRSWTFPFRWLAFVRLFKLPLPVNILRAHWLYQRNTRPMGHLPREKDRSRVVEVRRLKDETHTSIDKSTTYREIVLRQVRNALEYVAQRGTKSKDT